MNQSNTFSIDKSFYQPIKGFSDELLGKLFRAIFEYQVNGKDDCDPEIAIPFQFFLSQFKQEIIQKDKIRQINTLNGTKGGRPKKIQILTSSTPKSQMLKSANNDVITAIYQAYPAKCPIKGNNTGKCAKNREQIEKLLKIHTQSDLITTIQNYITDCKQSKTFIKNFGTFLNNLPDMGNNEEHNSLQDNTRKLTWHILPTGKTRESTKEQFELDKERFGEENVNFLGYAV